MTTDGLLLVVPSAQDDPTGRRLLALARALAAQTGNLQVLVWRTGPLAGAFAALAPTVDADDVNAWRPARLLARARLAPVARLAKNRRLRAVLAPLATIQAVVVGTPAGLDAVAWLPGGDRRVAVLVPPGADRAGRDDRRDALVAADVVVAHDPTTEAWLRDEVGVDPARLQVHALLPGALPREGPERPIGLVGWSAPAVGRLLATLAVAAPGDPAFTWFAPEEAAWSLWQGPTASPLANRLHTAPGDPTLDDVGDLAVLLATGDEPGTLAVVAAAGACGVPVAHHHAPDVDAAVTEGRSLLAAPPARPTPVGTLTVTDGAAALCLELGATRRG